MRRKCTVKTWNWLGSGFKWSQQYGTAMISLLVDEAVCVCACLLSDTDCLGVLQHVSTTTLMDMNGKKTQAYTVVKKKKKAVQHYTLMENITVSYPTATETRPDLFLGFIHQPSWFHSDIWIWLSSDTKPSCLPVLLQFLLWLMTLVPIPSYKWVKEKEKTSGSVLEWLGFTCPLKRKVTANECLLRWNMSILMRALSSSRMNIYGVQGLVECCWVWKWCK